MNNESIILESKLARSKKHLRKSKLLKVFQALRHHTFYQRKSNVMLRSMLILKGKAIYQHTFTKLREFIVNTKL